jgi:hypothetical protein
VAKVLNLAVLSWRDDQTLQHHGSFRGLDIFSRAKPTDEVHLFVRVI